MWHMKKYILFLIIIFLSGAAIAQEASSNKKAAKKARKAEKNRIALDNSQKLKSIITTKKFVLEAQTLFDRTGTSYLLSPTTNFVGFDGENSTIQLSFNGLIGWNGIGGITIDGKIKKLEIKGKEDQSNFSINASVLNKGGGLVTMIFRVSSDGNARVDMSGSFGERLSFQGRIVSLSETSVYKGTPIF